MFQCSGPHPFIILISITPTHIIIDNINDRRTAGATSREGRDQMYFENKICKILLENRTQKQALVNHTKVPNYENEKNVMRST